MCSGVSSIWCWLTFCWYGLATSTFITGGRWSRHRRLALPLSVMMVAALADSTAACSTSNEIESWRLLSRSHRQALNLFQPMRLPVLLLALVLLAVAAAVLARADDTYHIVHTYPHDPRLHAGASSSSTAISTRAPASTRPLFFAHGQSTKRILRSAFCVPNQAYFAEGLAHCFGRDGQAPRASRVGRTLQARRASHSEPSTPHHLQRLG